MNKGAAHTSTFRWDKKDLGFSLPDGCLSYTIVNKGTAAIEVFGSEEIAPNGDIEVSQHVGYFLEGIVPIHAENLKTANVHFIVTKEIR